MHTQHRSVVAAPTWALEALRHCARTARSRPAPAQQSPALQGLAIETCAFEAWLAAGGERRTRPRGQQAAQRGG